MALILAGLSAILYGVADFSGGDASRRSPILSVLALSQLAGAVLAVAALACLGTPRPAVSDLAWGLAAGCIGAVGLSALYRGIATSVVAVVSPVSALVGAVVPLSFGLASGERPSEAAIAGAALCLPAIVMLTWSRAKGRGRGPTVAALLHGLAAGLGFGGFFIAISRSSAASGLWPLVAARSASIACVLAVLALRGERLGIRAGARLPTALAGLADMGANILFLLAARSGMLSLVTIVTSLYPAPTVLLGAIRFGERVPPIRIAGIALAIAGVALISLK